MWLIGVVILLWWSFTQQTEIKLSFQRTVTLCTEMFLYTMMFYKLETGFLFHQHRYYTTLLWMQCTIYWNTWSELGHSLWSMVVYEVFICWFTCSDLHSCSRLECDVTVNVYHVLGHLCSPFHSDSVLWRKHTLSALSYEGYTSTIPLTGVIWSCATFYTYLVPLFLVQLVQVKNLNLLKGKRHLGVWYTVCVNHCLTFSP